MNDDKKDDFGWTVDAAAGVAVIVMILIAFLI